MSKMAAQPDDHPIPEKVRNINDGVVYQKGRFFGKGGFAKCFELIDLSTNATYAGKIISKALLAKNNQKGKLIQEIEIHRSLNHKNVVRFYTHFDDSHFNYIILELCPKRSLMELHKRRKVLTDPEVRFFLKQILEGIRYLHDRSIIHRDLKLGNLFLNDKLEVKIGDFGLAAKIEYPGQRKRTLCGTPNYIAPEILEKQGHSFQVDIWSTGCIMYTFMVGRPPFETATLKETYSRIKKCDYSIPDGIHPHGCDMIRMMLQAESHKRPDVRQLLGMDFVVKGYCPKELPLSCLNAEPRFDSIMEMEGARKPLRELNGEDAAVVTGKMPRSSIQAWAMPLTSGISKNCTSHLVYLYEKLHTLVGSDTPLKILPDNTDDAFLEEMSDPAAQPFLWFSKWVDYSDKYGFGYQLSDDGVGVMYNDYTRIILLANLRNVHYIERDGSESYYILGSTPPELNKKMKLLTYFRRYMNEHLMKAGSDVKPQESDQLSRIPYLHMWMRANTGVIMQLTNGTLQINFQDHSKVILCPLMDAVTYIDLKKNFRTFRFSTLKKHGCVSGLAKCLEYAFKKMPDLINKKPLSSLKSPGRRAPV